MKKFKHSLAMSVSLAFMLSSMLVGPQASGEEGEAMGGEYFGSSAPSFAGGSGVPNSVPLEFPDSRGGIPVPVRLVHDGGQMGAAGRGWGVPLSFVNEIATFAHRRPAGVIGGLPQAKSEVTLSLLGESVRLIPQGQNWIAQSGGMALTAHREANQDWKVYDGDGRTYTFSSSSSGIEGFSLLTRIEGADQAKVELDYDVQSHQVQAPSGQQGLAEYQGISIDLRNVRYNHSASGSPKHQITLNYEAATTQPLSIGVTGESVVVRMHKLESIDVSSRAQEGGALARLSRYLLHYGVDQDTLLPQLQSVTLSGRQGTAEANVEIPVASYQYGTATRNVVDANGVQSTEFRYEVQYTAQLPASAPALVIESSKEEPIGSRIFPLSSSMIDVTGDGRADFVYRNASGPAGLTVARNSPVSGTAAFPMALTGTFNDTIMPSVDHLAAFQIRTAIDPFPNDFYPFKTETGNDTLSQMLDVNGDGRPDRVVADELGNNQWVVYLNTPAGDFPHNTKWVRKVYDVSHIATQLTARGHILTGGTVPLMRNYSSKEFDARLCWEYDYGSNVWKRTDYGDLSSGPHDNWQGADAVQCAPIEVITEYGERSVEAWKLMDFNGDGRLDLLLADARPQSLMFEEPPCYSDASAPPQPGVSGCHIPPQNHRIAGGRRNYRMSGGHLVVMFNLQSVDTDIPNSLPVLVGGCGVGEWTNGGGNSYYPHQVCEIRDMNGDGLADLISVQAAGCWGCADVPQGVGHFVAYLGTGRKFSSGYIPLPESASYYRSKSDAPALETEFVDLTGDGIPEYVSTGGGADPSNLENRGAANIGTGSGFTALSVPIRTSAAASFRLSGHRVSHSLQSTAALSDMDGDGRVDFVMRSGSGVQVSRIIGSEGPGALSAGALIAAENGHGGRTEITYKSAKEDASTAHQSPYPEIVVSSVKTIQSSTNQSSETKYAYGNPIFGYDSFADRFRSFGYGRSIALTPVSAGSGPGLILGNATITDTYALAQQITSGDWKALFDRYLRAGRAKDVVSLSGEMSADPWTMLQTDVTTDGRRVAGSHVDYDSKVWPNSDAEAGCEDLLYPYDGGPTGLNTCKSRGFMYQSAKWSWHGTAAPPSTDNVMTDGHVIAIDDLGRVTGAYVGNDSRRYDDNVCVTTTYAAPAANTYPRVLSAVAESQVYKGTEAGQCSGTLLAAERNEYDSLPQGQVSKGLVTGHTVDRREADTGALIETIRSFDALYDAQGNVESITTTADNRQRTVQSTYDSFGLVALGSRVEATDVPTMYTSVEVDPYTLQPLSVTDTNGLQQGVRYDGFGRPTMTTVTPVGGVEGALGVTQYLNFESTDPLVQRTVVSTTFDNAVPPAQAPSALGHTTTAYLDDFGRAIKTLAELGSDYTENMIVGETRFDALGRVSFVADPYPTSQIGTPVYGTTSFFNTDGSPKCSIRGRGPQSLPGSLFGSTDETTERYPTCYSRDFRDGREIVGVWGPDALLTGSPQEGVQQLAESTAVGRLLARSTWNAIQRLEHSEFDHDYLGNVVRMTRYKSPGSASVSPSEPASWVFAYDSLGQLLRQDEPNVSQGVVSRFSDYSNWGEVVTTRATATGGQPLPDQRTAMNYDALGRLTHSKQTRNGEPLPETLYDYEYDVGTAVHSSMPTYPMLGQLASVTSPTSKVYFAYDAFGRPAAQATQAPDHKLYVETMSYDADGAVIEVGNWLPDTGNTLERVNFSYDSARRLRNAKFYDAAGGRPLYKAEHIDAFGRVRVATIGDDALYEANYADTGRRLLQNMTLQSHSGAQREVTFNRYDAVGRELSRTERDDTTVELSTYTYDALGRLSTSLRKKDATILSNRAFQYDPLGNLVTHDDLVGSDDVAMSYRSDNRDRMCSIGYGAPANTTACDVVHDALGNILQQPAPGGARSFEYLPSGQVSRITKPGGVQAQFRYDAFGDVQELDVTGSSTDNRHDRRYGSVEARDVVANGVTSTLLTRHFSAGGMSASRKGPQDKWVFALGEDRGNRFFVDEKGEFVQDVDYEAFGQASSQGAAPNSPNYTKEQWNGGDNLAAFGIHHLGARLYDPKIGRFLSVDPLVLMRTATTSNPYAFANNDPINSSDPTGLAPAGFDGGMTDTPIVGEEIIHVSGTAPLDPEDVARRQRQFDMQNAAPAPRDARQDALDAARSRRERCLVSASCFRQSTVSPGEGIKPRPFALSALASYAGADVMLDVGGQVLGRVPGARQVIVVAKHQLNDALQGTSTPLSIDELVATKPLPKLGSAPNASSQCPGGKCGSIPAQRQLPAGPAVRQLAAGPAVSVLDGHPAGQGFTGVYDIVSGKITLVPSMREPVKPGFVSRNGGHAVVSARIGGGRSNHVGFAAIIQPDGSVQLTWYSRQLNGMNGIADSVWRKAIAEGMEELSGRKIVR